MNIFDIRRAGYFVKIAVEKIVPEVDIVVNSTNNKVIYAEGYAIEVLKCIVAYFNFTYELVVSKERNFGAKKGGRWTGMVGMVQRQEANFSMILQNSYVRSKAVDFVHPDYFDEAVFIVLSPMPLPTAVALIKPFTSDVWVILFVTFPLVALCIKLMSLNFESRKARTKNFFWSFKEAIWYELGILLNAGGKMMENGRDSIRIMVFGWLVLSIVLCTTFSGQLVSFLNFPGLEEPIDNVEQLNYMIGKGKLVGGSIKKTFLHEALMVSKSEKIAHLRKSIQNDPDGTGSDSVEDGLRRILMNKPRYAFCWGRFNTRIIASRFGIQRFHYLGDRLFSVFTGNALPKGSFLRPHFDLLMIRLRESGVLAKFYKDQTDRGQIVGMFNSSYNVWNEDSGPSALTVEDLQGPFIILGLGYAVSFLALVYETVRHRLYKVNHSKVTN